LRKFELKANSYSSAKPNLFFVASLLIFFVRQKPAEVWQFILTLTQLGFEAKAPEGWSSPRRCAFLDVVVPRGASWTAAALCRFLRRPFETVPMLNRTATGRAYGAQKCRSRA
jgi:hypothetical protein